MTTGENLKRIMNELGVSAKQLSDDTGLAYTTIKRILEGDCVGYANTYKIIAEYLEVDISDFFK